MSFQDCYVEGWRRDLFNARAAFSDERLKRRAADAQGFMLQVEVARLRRQIEQSFQIEQLIP